MATLTSACDYCSYKVFQYRDCVVIKMLFYKLNAELNGLPDCSIANYANKSYMLILAILFSFLAIFWPKTEYQKESKTISIHTASCFKGCKRNIGIVILVYVH